MSKEAIKKVSKIGLAVVIGSTAIPMDQVIEAKQDEEIKKTITEYKTFLIKIQDESNADLMNKLSKTNPFLIKNKNDEEVAFDLIEKDGNYEFTVKSYDANDEYYLYFNEDENKNEITNQKFALSIDETLQEITILRSEEDIEATFENGMVSAYLKDNVTSPVDQIKCLYQQKEFLMSYDAKKKIYQFAPGINGDYSIQVILKDKTKITKTVTVDGCSEEGDVSYSVIKNGISTILSEDTIVDKDASFSVAADAKVFDGSFELNLYQNGSLVSNGLEQADFKLNGEQYESQISLKSDLSDGRYTLKLTGNKLNGSTQTIESSAFILDDTNPELSCNKQDKIVYMNKNTTDSTLWEFLLKEDNLSESSIVLTRNGKDISKKECEKLGIVIQDFSEATQKDNYHGFIQFNDLGSDGTYRIKVVAKDKNARESSLERTVVIDNVKPEISASIEGEALKSEVLMSDSFLYQIKVIEENFDETNTKVIVKTDSGEKTLTHSELTWIKQDNMYIADVEIDKKMYTDGKVNIQIESMDKAGNSERFTSNVLLDTTAPVISDVQIEKEFSAFGLMKLLFPEYFNDTILVSAKIEDSTTKVEEAVFAYVDENGKEIVKPELVQMKDDVYTYRIKLTSAEQRGYIKISAKDTADHQALYQTDGEVVIENIAPVLSFENSETAYVNRSMKEHRESIQIEEVNFDVKHTWIHIYKDQSEVPMSEKELRADTIQVGDFTQIGNTKHEAVIDFKKLDSDHEYKIVVESIDLCGNHADNIDKTVIIDNTAAVLESDVEITGNTGVKDYYNKPFQYVYTIKEKNFDASLAEVKVNDQVMDDVIWTKIAENAYQATLNYWNKDGKFDEGFYNVTLHYKDQAGNQSKEQRESFWYDVTACNVDVKEQKKDGNVVWENDGKWRNTVTSFEYTISDADSGVKFMEFEFKDNALLGNDKKMKVTFDNEQMYVNEKLCSDNTYQEDGFITLHGEQEGGAWKIIITFIGSSDVQISYTCQDMASNICKNENDIHVMQDISKPEFKDFDALYHNFDMDDSTWVNDVYTIQVDTNDNLSQVERVEYSYRDKKEWKTALLSSDHVDTYLILNDVENGTIYSGPLYMRIYDQAGNVSEEKEININIDKKSPVIELSNLGKAMNGRYYQNDVVNKVKISEHSFSEETTQITFYKNGKVVKTEDLAKEGITVSNEWSKVQDNEDIQLYHYEKEIKFAVEYEGVYSYEVSAIDKAGNQTIVTSETMVMDHTNPIANLFFKQTPNEKFKDDNYFKQDAVTVQLSINEHNFDENFINIEVQKDGKLYTTYQKSAWGSNEDIHNIDVTLQEEGHYKIIVNGKDLSGRSLTEQTTTLVIDHTLPIIDKDKDITFKEKNSSRFAQIANMISFGKFFNKEIEVTIHAKDDISGIDQIYFYYDGVDHNGIKDTILQNNVEFSTDNLKKLDGAVSSVHGNEMIVTFPLQPNFKGNIYAVAQDKAGNIDVVDSKKVYVMAGKGVVVEDTNEIEKKIKANIVTDIRPNNTLDDGTMLFNQDVPMHFDIEAPYSGIKSVTYQLGDMKPVTINSFKEGSNGISEKTTINDTIKSVIGGQNDKNDVILKLQVTDNAGNTRTFDKTIAIDRTAPVITSSFDNNAVYTGHYYNADRTLSLHINELNFEADKVNIKVTENGVVSSKTPKASDWRTNGTDHYTNILFNNDADYSVSMTYTDRSGNPGNTITIENFTIDKTTPKLDVSYDNNASKNSMYFNTARTATVKIEEHNFNAEKFNAQFSAQNDGTSVSAPSMSRWAKNGDIHTATVQFNNDADYSMQLSYIDEANNQMNPYDKDSFTVDLKNPEVKIENVRDLSSNRNPVTPTIEFSDTNIDVKGSSISVEGNDNGKVKVSSSSKEIKNGMSYIMEPLKLDDNYIVSTDINDLAGNKTNKSVSFSVNQNGSTFIFNQTLTNKKYINTGFKPIISIKNVDEVSIMSLTLNGISVPYTLENGTLTIDKMINKDGKYIINMEVRDAAGNVNSMPPIEFVYDSVKPQPIMLINNKAVEKIYFGPVTLSMKCENENDRVTAVYLNGVKLTDDKYEIDDGSIILKLNDYQDYQIQFDTIDDAGNMQKSDVYHFTLSNNILLRYYYNKPLFLGSVIVIGGVVIYLVMKHRKKEA